MKAAGDQGLGRSEISKLFSRNRSAEQINALVAELVATGQVEDVTEKAEGERGRPTIRAVWIDHAENDRGLDRLLDEPLPTKNEANETAANSAEPHQHSITAAIGPQCIGCGKSIPDGAEACSDCYRDGRVA